MEKKVASKAMKVWRQGFEPPRNGEKLRFSSGLKAEKRQLKRLQESKPSITTWLKKRRRNVNEQMEQTGQQNNNGNSESHDLETLKKKARTAARLHGQANMRSTLASCRNLLMIVGLRPNVQINYSQEKS